MNLIEEITQNALKLLLDNNQLEGMPAFEQVIDEKESMDLFYEFARNIVADTEKRVMDNVCNVLNEAKQTEYIDFSCKDVRSAKSLLE